MASLLDNSINDDVFIEKMNVFAACTVSNDYTIRNLGRSSLFRLMRVLKTAIKKTEVIKNDP